MAFQLNLYHELHKEAQERARDPFKLATYGGIAIALLLLLYYGFLLMSVHDAEHRARTLKQQWAQLEPEAKEAVQMEGELLAAQETNKALIRRLHNRFYWAPLLEQFVAVVPAEVQIQTMECLGEGNEPKRVNLRGLAAGTQPRSVAEAFRRTLLEKLGEQYDAVTVSYSGHDSLTETSDTVTLNGETLAVARFGFKIEFTPRSNAAEPAASPKS